MSAQQADRRVTRLLDRHRAAGIDHAGGFDSVPSAAGLHVRARLVRGTPADADRVIERAREAGVAVESLARHYADRPPEAGFVIGYGAIPAARIEEGLRLLTASLPAAAPW